MIKDNVFIVPVSNPFGKFGKIKHTLTLPFIQYHNVLHIHVHDRDQMYKYVDIGIIYKVFDYGYLIPRPCEPRYRCLVHLNQINTSNVIVKNVFLHNGSSSFAYFIILNVTMTIWLACLSALHLIECLNKPFHTTFWGKLTQICDFHNFNT